MRPQETPRRKVFGRRRGKKLRASQERLMAELLPQLRVPGLGDGDQGFEFEALFPDAADVWMEIGFGGGEHLAHVARARPQIGLIGCEPFLNGVAMALGKISAQNIENVRIHPADARDLLDLLPDGALGRVYLLYPDPWPKARHQGRRFMNPENLAQLHRVMRQDAEIYLATDIAAYAGHALAVVADSKQFQCVTDRSAIHEPWVDWPGTRYEAKALKAGRVPHYLRFARR